MTSRENYFLNKKKAYIIAEIGVNHNGDVALAKKMIKSAKLTGADAVKFQTYSAKKLASADTPKVGYQVRQDLLHETHLDMLLRLELSKEAHIDLFNFCDEIGIQFISTPYDIESAIFLNDLGVPFFKTASADLTDLPLQKFIAKLKKPVVIATGMASLGEVEDVVNIYRQVDNNDIALLHCVSNYPCKNSSLNLKAMSILHNAFGVPVGFSDHSEGFMAAALSISLGAVIIEKHFTLDKNLPGPDHLASSTPAEFRQMIEYVRLAEEILGSAYKRRQPEEIDMANTSRKSISINKVIKSGERLKAVDLCLIRPGTGVPSKFLSYFEGKIARANLLPGQLLKFENVE